MSIPEPAYRIDKKCGASGIADNKVCKKANTRPKKKKLSKAKRALIIGGALALTAGVLTAASRSGQRPVTNTSPIGSIGFIRGVVAGTRSERIRNLEAQQASAARSWPVPPPPPAPKPPPKASAKGYVTRNAEETKTAAAYWVKPRLPYRAPKGLTDVSAAFSTKSPPDTTGLTGKKIRDVSAAFRKYT
jgi:hypothetical protein